jgi:cytochrome d ubiquinol oxidase subunit I
VWVGAFILGSFFMMSVSAYYLLRGRHLEVARRSFTIALVWGAIVSLGALGTGHISAQIVGRTQPAKLAAFEGHFHTGTGPAPSHLIGLPDLEAEEVRYSIEIPRLLTLMVHDDLTTPVTGLDAFPVKDRPPVKIVFFTFHVMVALGMGFIGLTLLALLLRWRGTLFETRWLLKVFVVAVLGPFAANQLGWVSAEVGRQPWLVYGLLRTSDGLSKAVRANQVLSSIILFSLVYVGLFAVWVFVLNSKIQHGPDDGPGDPHDPPPTTRRAGLLEAASGLADPSGPSLTDTASPGAPDPATTATSLRQPA